MLISIPVCVWTCRPTLFARPRLWNPKPKRHFLIVGDNTALVCVDHQQYQKMIVPQLIDMTYKVHLGLFEEDVMLKLKTYIYNVVIIYENFKGSTLPTNPILREMIQRPGRIRREHFVVLSVTATPRTTP